MLVEQRNEWKREFEEGIKPFNPVLDEYKANRNSESWRSSSMSERICEYTLFLESNVRNKLTDDEVYIIKWALTTIDLTQHGDRAYDAVVSLRKKLEEMGNDTT